MTVSGLPPELAKAINSAASRYKVPPDLLVGIWHVESGSKFPNPYDNGEGYGGLFGGRNWQSSTQAQADLAASILATGLQRSGGNISEALSYYNSGKLQGGYTSVPGETTFGNVAAPTDVPPAPTDIYTAPPRPGGTDTSFSLTPFLEDPTAVGAFESIFGNISSATSTVSVFKNFALAFAFLLNPLNWLRAFEALLGTVFVLFGLYYFGKGDGGSDVSVSTLLRSPGRLAGGAAGGASRQGRAAAGESLTGRAASAAVEG